MTDALFLGFAPQLVPLVKSGRKTMTYRLGDKYTSVKPGDVLPVKNSGDGKLFGQVIISNISTTTFKELPINRNGHEGYASKDEQRAKFEIYYGRSVVDEEPVIILEYKFKV